MASAARDKIMQVVADNQARTVRQLMKLTGVTRQRVHQILVAEGLAVVKDEGIIRPKSAPKAAA